MVFAGVAFEVFIAADNPSYGSPLERWGSTVANAFVALGVLGEIVAASRGRVIQGELTRRSNDGLAEANKAAGEANERAAKAEQAAAEATERAIKLEQRIAGRSIPNEGFSVLVDLFKSLDPKPLAVVVEYEIRDRETYSFAGELRQAIWEAGLPSVLLERDQGGSTFGTFLGDVPPGRGYKLLHGFAAAGLGGSLLTGDNVNRWGGAIKFSDLYIFVGTKAPEMSSTHIDRLFARGAAMTAQAQKGAT